MTPFQYLKRLRFQLFYHWLVKSGVPLVTRGKVCQWTFCDTGLNSTSTVLCAGAGHDISFEKSLITQFGCQVMLLDPSPTGITTVERENIPSNRLKFLPIGLAGKAGTEQFEAPENSQEGSFRQKRADAAEALEFQCKTLSGLMAEFGWKDIDLLKIDIEGFEYGVIENLLKERLEVRQICVEFHYGPAFGHVRRDMIQSILALRKAGYDLVYHINQDHTFLRRDCFGKK